MKVILQDDRMQEKLVDFKFIPDVGSILEIDLNKTKTKKARFRIVSSELRLHDTGISTIVLKPEDYPVTLLKVKFQRRA